MSNHLYLRRLCLALLSLGLTGLLGCADVSARRGTLAPRLKPGQTYSQKVHLVSDMKMLFPRADYQQSDMILNYRVDAIDKKGLATVTVTIASLKASMGSLTIACSYDSDLDPTPTPPQTASRKMNHQQRFEQAFAPLKGKSYRALIDKHGTVLQLIDVDPSIKRASTGAAGKGPWGGYQLGLLLSPHHLREYVALTAFAALGSNPAKTGQTWTSYEVIETPRSAPVMARKNYTIDSVEKGPEQTQVLLSFNTAHAFDKPLPQYAQTRARNKKTEMQITSVKGSGKATFSLSKGHLIKFNEKIIAQVNVAGIKTPPNPKDKRKRTFYVVEKTIEYLDD